jgi:DNA-binding MarR family transcriptional regulator
MQAYQRSTQAFDDEVGRTLDLNPTDLRGLDWLHSDGPLSASRLAEATGLSAAATTAMIDRLQRKGFVERVAHPTDRRQVLVAMTDAGRARSGAPYSALVDEGRRHLDGFATSDLAAMRDYLVTIRELTDAHRDRLRTDRRRDQRAGVASERS